MTRRLLPLGVLCWAGFGVLAAIAGWAQNSPSERTFPQSKAAIEKALRSLQGKMAGRLPVLDGFAQPVDGCPLERFQRGYYQATADVASAPEGSLVKIVMKVTAWYDDPTASRSGYQLLKSNGRLEADLLDQLEEQLSKSSPPRIETPTVAKTTPKVPAGVASEPAISAPEAQAPETSRTFSSSLNHDLSPPRPPKKGPDKASSAVQTEIDTLQEVLKNTAHPKNLVAVKKSGTPVVGTPSLTAKTEFLASQHDEFELLDFNADWVHVRISGLSRGWIWRNSVEMPDGIPDTETRASSGLVPAADLFHVIREEVAPFPGDWEPLRSKSVKIISVQKVDENAKDSGSRERLEYTRYLLEKNYPEIAKKPDELHGIVVIFDSADGGMIAAPAAALQQWKAGGLSDSALWHKCFFDPPETFDSTASPGSK